MPKYSHFKSTNLVSVALAALLSIAQTNASDNLEEVRNSQQIQMHGIAVAQPVEEIRSPQTQDRSPVMQPSVETSGEELLNFFYVFNNMNSETKKTLFKALGFKGVCSFIQTNTSIFKQATGYDVEAALQKKGFGTRPPYQPLASCSDLTLQYSKEDSLWILKYSRDSKGYTKKVSSSTDIPRYYLYGLVGEVHNLPQFYWHYCKNASFQHLRVDKFAITNEEARELGRNMEGSQIRTVTLSTDLKYEILNSLRTSHPSIKWKRLDNLSDTLYYIERDFPQIYKNIAEIKLVFLNVQNIVQSLPQNNAFQGDDIDDLYNS